MNPNKTLAILCFDGMTMMDAIGPHEVLANCPGIEVVFVAKSPEVFNDHRTLRFLPQKSLADVTRADYLLIPGAPDMSHVLEDTELLSWVRAIDTTSEYTLSVCSGSLLLARAGLLMNTRACCHWAYLDELAQLGARPVRKRFQHEGKYLTSSGVSAGIDLSLYLVTLLQGKEVARMIQFTIEYFPNRFDLISSYSLPASLLRRKATEVKQMIRESFVSNA
jgi:transcriptional regulator GlxA family with amidase domain